MPPREEQTVWLGMPGDMVDVKEKLNHHATKCGGMPHYPGHQPPLLAGDLRCSVCSGTLSLILQAYAPAGAYDQRCLLVFGCTAEQCGKHPGSWRAWRCQLPSAEHGDRAVGAPVAMETADHHQQRQQQLQKEKQQQQQQVEAREASGCVPGFDFSTAADDWGLGDASGGGAFSFDAAPSNGSGSGGGAFDFSDLTSAVEQAATDLSVAKQRPPGPKAAAQQTASEGAGAGAALEGAAETCSCTGEAGPRLPEFHVYSDEEPADAGIPERELQHARRLLAEYQQAPAAGGDADELSGSGGGTSQGRRAGGGGGGACGKDEDGGGAEAWGGEGYEPTQLRGVVRSYVKFSKRVARQPMQCARYCPGSSPLWPHPSPPRAAPCSACGAPRAFEVQLMPALIQMLLEGAEMEQRQREGALTAAAAAAEAAAAAAADEQMQRVLSAVSQWDWCTIAVFTCTANCCGSSRSSNAANIDSCCCLEEQILIVNEQELHTQRESAAAAAATGLHV